MTAIVTRLTEEPVGAAVSTLPLMLPSTGVTDYVERWSISSVDPSAPLTTKVPTWIGSRGRMLQAPNAEAAPNIATPNGVRSLVFDGADDFLQVGGLPAIRGLTLVARVYAPASTNQGIWDGGSGDVGVVRTAANKVGLFYNTATASVDAPDAGAWAFYHAYFGDQGFVDINAATAGPAAPSSNAGATSLRLGRHNADFGQIAVAEVIVWDRVLSQVERGVLRTALRAAYPAIPA